MDTFLLATAKIATFTVDIVWKSCSKFNLEQLFDSMSVPNIASLAVAKEAVLDTGIMVNISYRHARGKLFKIIFSTLLLLYIVINYK